MKKTLLAFVFFAAVQFGAYAQGYTFSQTTATYTDLASPTMVSGNVIWDDSSYTVPIGFPFSVGSGTFNDAEINSNGVLIFNSGTTFAAIVAYDADFASLGTSTSTSPISYQLSGSAGSRVFKIQWKNAGFYDGTASDFVNLQVWLYEGSNKVEIRIGPTTIGTPATIFGPASGPGSGIATDVDFFNQTLSGLFLQGNPAAATAVTVTNSSSYPSLSGVPANGTMYVYNKSLVGVAEDLKNATVAVYPNPVTDVFRIEGLVGTGNVTIKLFDALGKVVLTREVPASATIPVEVKDLAKGTYYLEIVSGNSHTGKQVIKL